jgi:hypothetical protein
VPESIFIFEYFMSLDIERLFIKPLLRSNIRRQRAECAEYAPERAFTAGQSKPNLAEPRQDGSRQTQAWRWKKMTTLLRRKPITFIGFCGRGQLCRTAATQWKSLSLTRQRLGCSEGVTESEHHDA